MMPSFIHRLASLKITIVLLVLLLLTLSAGTIVESSRGAETAQKAVYGSLWFKGLLGCFAINLLCSILHLWPWGRSRIGYIITHASMLIILAGSLTTELFKTEGVLPIWEGEENAVVRDRAGAQNPVVTLPFTVHLDSFEVEYYEGTRRPAQFRSRVTVKDGGRSIPVVIQMNQELSYGGYRFFQSSYQQAKDRDMTILSVSHDPGQNIVFFGYFSLVAGMLVVLATRISDRRRAARAAGVAALLVAAFLPVSPAHAQWSPSADEAKAISVLPVQNDGRIMPFDTLARNTIFEVTGRKSLWGLEPTAVVLGMAFDPRGWVEQPIVPIGGALSEALGLKPGTRWATFHELVESAKLHELVDAAYDAQNKNEPLTPLQKDAQKLEGRLVAMQDVLQKKVFSVMPATEPGAPWSVPAQLQSPADLTALLNTGVAPPARAAAMQKEVAYNRLHPSRVAWWILAASLALSIAAWNGKRRFLDIAAGATLLAGFAVMTYGIWLRWTIAGRIPASNMYESLLFLGWGVGLFALIATIFLRNRIVILNAAAMSALTMALTDLLPIDPFIHPMAPVLSGTYWLAIHVPIIMVSYSVLALGVVVAHMQIGFEIFASKRRDLYAKMVELLYFYIMIGSILLIAGIITGSMWAAESWGRYWGWDPKEVWSLVAFLAYMAILHARAEKLIDSFGVAAWSIVAFQTILMTYLGVNFVLSSGLHSYGFGESNVVRAMVAVALAELAFLGAGWMHRRRRLRLQR